MSIWNRIFGGWKTHGPNASGGPGAWAGGEGDAASAAVTADMAMRLSAVSSCVELRAEVIGSLPLHLRDRNKKLIPDHPLYDILHNSPNADQTSAEFWSMITAQVDMLGNAVCIISRGYQKAVTALTPIANPDECTWKWNKSKTRKTWIINGDEHHDDDILHFPGFTISGGWGASRLDIGRQIIRAQLDANTSAQRAFKQGLKVGGFFGVEKNLDTEQLKDFGARLDTYGKQENAGKWMTLLAGMKPIAGTEFAVKPSDAQLLESRYFGIEEICRLFRVPPPLINHTSKASSWASSLENINLHFLMYSIQPTIVRSEKRMGKKLLTREDRAAGIESKFSIRSLQRADAKTQNAAFASGLQNGYYCINDVLDFLDLPHVEGGDVHRVQVNLHDITEPFPEPQTTQPKPNADEDEEE